jgi:IS30 family transposase
MRKKGRHLTFEDRVVIEKMLSLRKTILLIAQILRKGVGTVSEEVNRNSHRGKYTARRAHKLYEKREQQRKAKVSKVLMHEPTKFWVEKNLKEGASSYIISKMSRTNSHVKYLSIKSINKYKLKKKIGLI